MEDQPPPDRAQDERQINAHKSIQKVWQISLSEDYAARLKVRVIRMIRKASSPRLLVTYNNKRVILLIDEGSEINVVDGDFAEENDIRSVRQRRVRGH